MWNNESLICVFRRKNKPLKRSEEECHESKNIYLLKNKKKSYIRGITKPINSITELFDQNGSFNDFDIYELMNFMNFSEFGKSLESHYQNIRDLTTEIVGSESDDNIVPPELQICTEQEFRGVQIRNAISLYPEIKGVSPIKLNKETNPLTLNVFHRITRYQNLKLLHRLKMMFYWQIKH